MTYVAVTQRVYAEPSHGTRLDAVDQRWWAFLRYCGLTPLPVPNTVTTARRIIADLPVSGILLTGGNDLYAHGGTAPERDVTELALVDEALRRNLPLLGVCRGMQVIQHYFGVALRPVSGHVTSHQIVTLDCGDRVVNSYHRWAATGSSLPLRTWAHTRDGVVKAVRHDSVKILGIMWHPERMSPFAPADRVLFQAHFSNAPWLYVREGALR